MSCSAGLAKLILFVVNFLVFLIGAVTFGIGVYLKISPNDAMSLLNRISSDGNITDNTSIISFSGWLFIILGIFIVLVGFSGCWGAFKESTFLLYVYSTIFVILIVVEVVGLVFVLLKTSTFEKEGESFLVKTLQKNYVGVESHQYTNDANSDNSTIAFSKIFDTVQIYMECCGVESFYDYKNFTTWNQITTQSIPVTCCTMKDIDKFVHTRDWQNLDNYIDKKQDCLELKDNAFNKVGCWRKVSDNIARTQKLVFVVILLILLVEITAIILACMLLSSINRGF